MLIMQYGLRVTLNFDAPSPDMLPELAGWVDVYLAEAKLVLGRLRKDRRLGADDIERTSSVYREVIAVNERMAAHIKVWLRLGKIAGDMIRKARRTLLVLERINGVAVKILVAALKYKRKPRRLTIPLSEIGIVAEGIERLVVETGKDLQLARTGERLDLPLMTRNELKALQRTYVEVQDLVDGMPPLLRRWRKQGLTPTQKQEVAGLAKRVRLVRAQVKELLFEVVNLQSKRTFDRGDDAFGSEVLKGLVSDH